MLSIAKKIQTKIISAIDWLHTPFSKYLSPETFRYGVTGGANSIFDIFLYYIFYNFIFDKQILDLKIVSISPYIAAFLFVFPITFTTGFMLAKYITFTQSVLKGKVQLIRYVLSVAGSILLNYLLLKLFVEVVGLYATLSKILTTIIVIFYSYIIQKHFTFRTGKRALATAMQYVNKDN
jgi:putative flippase GtrA